MYASASVFFVCILDGSSLIPASAECSQFAGMEAGKVAGIGRGIVVFGMLKACRIYGLFRNDAEYFCEVVEIKGVLRHVI